jgi:hypothetical protein
VAEIFQWIGITDIPVGEFSGLLAIHTYGHDKPDRLFRES